MRRGLRAARERMQAAAGATLREANGWQREAGGVGVYGTPTCARAGRPGPARRQPAGGPGHAAAGRRRPGRGRGRLAPLSPALRQRPVAAAGAFWSLAAYDAQGLLAPNALNRQALGSRDPLRYNEDGSLDLVLGHEAPAPEQQSNWLPLPASGPAHCCCASTSQARRCWTAVDAAAAAVGKRRPRQPPRLPAAAVARDRRRSHGRAERAGGRSRPHRPPRRHGVLAACGPGQGRRSPAAPLTGAATRAGRHSPPAGASKAPAPSAQERQRRARASRYHIHFSNQERPTWTTPSATNCR